MEGSYADQNDRDGAAQGRDNITTCRLPPADPKLDAMLDDPLAPDFPDAIEAYHGREPDFDLPITTPSSA
jgi:hypothetical protein